MSDGAIADLCATVVFLGGCAVIALLAWLDS